MKEQFVKMFRHMAWSDRRIGEVLAASQEHSAEGAVGARGTPAEAIRLYAHIISAEHTWLSRLEGGPSFAAPLFPDWNAELCRIRSEEVLTGFERFLEREINLEQEVVYRNSTGAEFRTSIADVLTHVFLHGSYHRGQMNKQLRYAGMEPVPLDYIAYIREQSSQ